MLTQEKVNQAKAILKEFKIDCWITFTRESALNGDPTLPFLINGDVTWHSMFIITSSGKTFAIVGQYDKMAVEDLGAYDEVIGYVEGIKSQFIETLRKINPSSIAANYSMGSEICDGLTHGMYLTLFEFLSEAGYEDRLIPAEKIISALRQRKTVTEIKLIKEAIVKAESILDDAARFIKPGVTENEIADFIKEKVRHQHLDLAWDEKTCPSVFTGPEHAGAHYHPTERVVRPGHVLNIDFGVKFNHYCSDLQRTFYILKKGEMRAPEPVQRGFDTIVESIELSRLALKPGVKGVEVDKVAREHIVKNGYAEFPHGLGHQVGRFAHDGTALLGPAWEKYAQKPFQLIEKGMVFTIEPRLTVEGYGVATVEEMVLVGDNDAEFISHPQKKLRLIAS
ncbi:aminopeptidase P family protein [bacterium]|nr:MAG: aminopeptidase P family protein [bacterium]